MIVFYHPQLCTGQEKGFTIVSFKDEDVLKIIKPLNVNKAHGHDDISNRFTNLRC